MAKQIIVLDRFGEPSDLNFNVIYWIAVPSTRQSFYAKPTQQSAYKNIDVVTELPLLQNGSIVEIPESLSYAAGTPLATIQTDLIKRFTALQADMNSKNPYVRYGTFFDGTTWTVGGVA